MSGQSALRSRREEEKLARRVSIVDAAEAVFFDKGVARTSMDDVARRARLSRALIYVYFKDKQDLHMAVVHRAAEMLLERFQRAAGAETVGMKKVRAIGGAYYRFMLECPDHFNMLTQGSSQVQEAAARASEESPNKAALTATREATMMFMTEVIREGLADGSIDAGKVKDPLQTAYFLRGSLHGVMMLTRAECLADDGMTVADPDALIDYTFARMNDSIGARGKPGG